VPLAAYTADHLRQTISSAGLQNLVGSCTGEVGREKLGLMPIRGHSGVQGGAEVDCTPGLDENQRARFEQVWGFRLPDFSGLTAADMVVAAYRGDLDVFWIVGGNFLETLPDPEASAHALRNVSTRIHPDVVVSSMMLDEPKETVILFPATTRYESPGGGTETTAERRIIFSPEIAGRRIGSAKPEWEVFGEVAARGRTSEIEFASRRLLRLGKRWDEPSRSIQVSKSSFMKATACSGEVLGFASKANLLQLMEGRDS
jgi:predicted molibdopterin-dependent oxidoreductase YjgC